MAFRRQRKPAVASPPAADPAPPPAPPDKAPLPVTAAELTCEVLPEDSVALDAFASLRQERVRQQLTGADVERRISRCVDTLLSAEELPMNPFPTLVKLLRPEELAVALETAASERQRQRGISRRGLWREADAQTSQMASHLARLPSLGASWRPIAPMLDGDSISSLAMALVNSTLLLSSNRTVSTAQGTFTVKSCCALTGAHAFAGRLVAHPRTLEMREHVQVRGPAARLDGALAGFTEHICATALSLHASKEHFVIDLEVFTGDGDVFDDEASAEGGDGRTTTITRGTPERFDVAAMHTPGPSLSRALLAAVLARLPVYLNLLACTWAPGSDANDGLPPRWQVRRCGCLSPPGRPDAHRALARLSPPSLPCGTTTSMFMCRRLYASSTSQRLQQPELRALMAPGQALTSTGARRTLRRRGSNHFNSNLSLNRYA